MTEMDKPGT